MRAGFELYRAFARDAENNRDAHQQNGMLTVPVLALGGATSGGALVEQMMLEVAENVTGMVVPGAAHWIPEEAPEVFSAAMLEFLAGADREVVGSAQNATVG
jgi:pimeloyl-ACP methyl ester carboxylesterase